MVASFSVADTRIIQDINVTIGNLTHTFDGDLDIFLVAPNGTRVELSTDNGGTGDNFVNTVFDDQAATSITVGTPPYTGSFKPEGLLSTLNGIPANGTWTLEITDDATTDVGTTHGVGDPDPIPAKNCPTVGEVTIDKSSYQCAETVQIHVEDSSILGAGTQPVTIASTAEGAGETVVLNETPANSGIFDGSITLTAAAPSTGDGFLSVADGGSLTVTYIDANDGFGHLNVPRTDTAFVDCSAPAITNVQAINVTGRAADITWTTNEGSNSDVFYGTTAPRFPWCRRRGW